LEDNNRVVTSIKIDDRKDKQVTAEDKVKSVCSENEQLSPEVKKWLQYKSKNFLEKLGFKRHHVVFDFGCRSGNYTIPAAEIVGITGRVYGTDKDKNRLKTLTEKAAAKKLNNITILESSNWHTEIKENPVDHIMLFDVLHPGYFPTKSARKNLLRKIYKVLKPGGIISIVPTHVEQRDLPMKDFIEEVENPGFSLKKSFEEFLVHDRKLEKCRILQFQKQRKEKSHGKNKR
jgi:ubiquinone/menaquinone biosynthesis C-methylase UbiE